MTECEKQIEEFIELLKRADANKIAWIEKCLILFQTSSGFNAAYDKAIPPGEVCPPAEVMRNLVNKWAEKEGL